MKNSALLFLCALCSALGAQGSSRPEANIAHLTEQANRLLNAHQEEPFSVKTGHPQAKSLYDELELTLTEYRELADANIAILGQANEILFKLSNSFNLKTPIKQLADELKSILEVRSSDWVSKTGIHLTPSALANPAKKEETISYLTYILSGLGEIEVSKIFAMIPYVLNVSYNQAREYLKNILLYRGYREPSALNQRRVTSALKKCNYEHDVIVVESPDPKHAAMAMSLPPFGIIVLSSRSFNDVQFEEFALYNAIGHLYHNHALTSVINRARIRAGSLAAPFLATIGLSYGLPVAFVAPLTISVILTIVFKSLALMSYSRSQQHEADLFACNKLIKLGHINSIFNEAKQFRTTGKHHEATYQLWSYLTQKHPSDRERNLYLTECMKNQGVWGPYLKSCTKCKRIESGELQCSCKNKSNKSVTSTITTPCQGKIVVTENGTMVCKRGLIDQQAHLILSITNWLAKLKENPADKSALKQALSNYNSLRKLHGKPEATSINTIDIHWVEKQSYKLWKAQKQDA